MKNKFFLLLLIFISVNLLSISKVDSDDYLVKAGDEFVIQVCSFDTLNYVNPVLPEGNISLFPIGNNVNVADKSLKEAKKLINQELERNLKNSTFNVQLAKVSPISFYVTGAVRKPGFFVADSLITLDTAVNYFAKILPQASRKIKVTRNNKEKIYNLNKLLDNFDHSQNPIVSNNDLIEVDYVKDFVSVYSNNDTLATIQYLEIEDNKTSLKEALNKLQYKFSYLDFSKTQIKRSENYIEADLDTKLKKNDEIYLVKNSRYIFVNGYVNNPSVIPYEGNRDINYYLGLAGGIAPEGSSKKIVIIDKNGEIKSYNKKTTLKAGDTIHVKMGLIYYAKDFIAPIASIFTVIYTVIRIDDIMTKN